MFAVTVIVQQVCSPNAQLGLQGTRGVVYSSVYHTAVVARLMGSWEEGGTEGGTEGGREGGRRNGGRNRGREGGREGGRNRGREGGREVPLKQGRSQTSVYFHFLCLV